MYERNSCEFPIRTHPNPDPLNLHKGHSRLEVKKHSFSIRVVDKWNDLESSVKAKTAKHGFKNAIKSIRSRVLGDDSMNKLKTREADHPALKRILLCAAYLEALESTLEVNTR